MTSLYFVRVAGGLLIAGLLICSGFAAIEPNEKGVQVNEKMAAAAKATLKATQVLEVAGRASVEDVYRWSLHIVESEDFSAQSIEDHKALMRVFHNRSLALNQAGVPGGEENILHATEYYLAESEGFGGK